MTRILIFEYPPEISFAPRGRPFSRPRYGLGTRGAT